MAIVQSEIDGVTGHACIWTGEGREPFLDPFGHADRVKYSSLFRYRKIIDARAFTLNLPQTWYLDEFGIKRCTSANQLRTEHYTLYAHERPGTPWPRGCATIGGQVVSLSGSVMVQAVENCARFISLGADATSVKMFEYSVQRRGSNNQTINGFDAISIPITVFMTDKILISP